MQKPLLLAFLIASLLLNSGCQSSSTQQLDLQTSHAECLPPPPPEAWFMESREANLTQRMLKELSESPVTVTKD